MTARLADKRAFLGSDQAAEALNLVGRESDQEKKEDRRTTDYTVINFETDAGPAVA